MEGLDPRMVWCCQAHNTEKAESLLRSMRKALCPPSLYTYTALINAYAREGNCVRAEEIFAELQSIGFIPDVYTYNALLEAYRSLITILHVLV